MLQIADIKTAQKNCPEPLSRPNAANVSSDNASAAGFFDILRGQIDTTAQAAVDIIPKADTARNDMRADAAEREQVSRDAAHSKNRSEETSRAEAAETDQAAKDAAHARNTQNKEAKSAETVKNADKKTADAPREKKSADSVAGPASHPARSQRTKKTEDSDMRELFDGLHRMLDIIKGKDQSGPRAAHSGGREAEDLLAGGRSRNGLALLKSIADRLAAATARLDGRKIPAEQADILARMAAGMRDALQKSRHGLDRGRGTAAATAPDQNLSAVKDLLARVESLLQEPKGEGARNNQGGDSRGNSDAFNFTNVKIDFHGRKAETASGPHRQASFMEQVGQIIDNAKVVVRDSRNGSFSVRLYPRELGSMNVSLGLENGVVHGKFLVESREAKDLLMGSIEQIKQDLNEAGIAVGEFHVDVDDRRGRMLRDSDSEGDVFTAPVERREEIAAGFESNSKSFHDGHINLVI